MASIQGSGEVHKFEQMRTGGTSELEKIHTVQLSKVKKELEMREHKELPEPSAPISGTIIKLSNLKVKEMIDKANPIKDEASAAAAVAAAVLSIKSHR